MPCNHRKISLLTSFYHLAERFCFFLEGRLGGGGKGRLIVIAFCGFLVVAFC